MPDPERDIERVAEWLWHRDWRAEELDGDPPSLKQTDSGAHYQDEARELLALLDREQERIPSERLRGVAEQLRERARSYAERSAKANDAGRYEAAQWADGAEYGMTQAADEIEACLSAPETSAPEEAPAQIESASGRVSYADGKPEGRDTAAPVDDREQEDTK